MWIGVRQTRLIDGKKKYMECALREQDGMLTSPE